MHSRQSATENQSRIIHTCPYAYHDRTSFLICRTPPELMMPISRITPRAPCPTMNQISLGTI
jgi:hypothetical protein